MRYCWLAILLLALLAEIAYAESSNHSTEGGNITVTSMNVTDRAHFWAAIIGELTNVSTNISLPVSYQDTPEPIVYRNDPNGTYSIFYNTTMVVTRLPFKPNISEMSTPNISDFQNGGLFSNFSVFDSYDYSTFVESPSNTFGSPLQMMTCYVFNTPFLCPYITLSPNIRMGVLKFSNGTTTEPLFLDVMMDKTVYNGSILEFEYLVPALERYFFYLYGQQNCTINVWIDGVQTTTFPSTAVPYSVDVLVSEVSTGTPLPNLKVDAVEENGRNLLFPLLELGRRIAGLGATISDTNGRGVFALAPTRYNIPDSYLYQPYIEVNDGGYYCRQNLTVAQYSYLAPTYRSSLVNPSYGSAVKASVQNMNALASIASNWVTQGKMKVVNVDVYTNGTHSSLPLLKVGAPNLLNITLYNATTLEPINSSALAIEAQGHIIFVPQQPDKIVYTDMRGFSTNQTIFIIPTRYNNVATLNVTVGPETSPYSVLVFSFDSLLTPPASSDADMDVTTRSAISSAMQNIDGVLINIARSISTV